MFAVIKTGGKQYLVHPGDKIKLEKLETSQGKEVVFSDVLMAGDEGKGTVIGTPIIMDYIVRGKILKHGKRKKIIVYKYKPKKRYDKKQGHRQFYTEVEILDILQGGIEKGAAKKTVGTKKTSKPSTAKKIPKTEQAKNEK